MTCSTCRYCQTRARESFCALGPIEFPVTSDFSCEEFVLRSPPVQTLDKWAVILNGPPRSGKDTIARLLARAFPSVVLDKFARPIVDYMLALHGVEMEHVDKDVPHPNLHGKTPRQVAIAYSERMCKPTFGRDYFGREAVKRLADLPTLLPVVVYSDGGFLDETEPLVRALPAKRVLQIRVVRAGKTFEGDSRSYWEHREVPSVEFENRGETLAELAALVRAELVPIVAGFLEG